MKATFAAGCFWSVEYEFSQLPGIISMQAGYIDGDEKNYPKPTYEQVCSKKTNYAEAVEVEFDEKKISYEKLLEIFWNLHDPTTLNRQGPDVGTQYRSAIFYHSSEQKSEAESSMKKRQAKISGKIVTQISQAPTFFRAEEYHQKYAEKHGGPTCHM